MSAGTDIVTPKILTPSFSLGQVVATPAALELLERFGVNASDLLRRHAAGDWGELDPDDKRLNDEALTNGSRLLSSYDLGPIHGSTEQVWIITEACDEDGRRSHTTILRPGDY